jgi:WD40 repeat protein/serine/threonine protein kinase
MLKGLFGLGRRSALLTAHVPAAPASPIGPEPPPVAPRAGPAPTLTRPIAAVSGREPGQLLGGVYPVLRRLGEGGFGEVFLCRHPAWNIEVAVKLPHESARADPRTLPDLEHEAEEWTGLGLHPNITYCYHLHPVGTPPLPLLVVEYVAGGTLRQRIEGSEAVSDLPGNLDLAIQLCHALEHAHGRGLVHRDLKPENVLLAVDGTVKLTDFGIARRGTVGGASGAPGGVVQSSAIGTKGYMAPEQMIPGAEIDARTDLYALGACLYELFCFALPYSGRAAAGRTPLSPAALRRDRALPEGLDALLRRLVSWDAAGRPASAQAVREELAAIYQAAHGAASKYAELPELSLTASGHNNRGVSYHFLGKLEQAEAAFRDALAADPLHPEATFNLGLMEWRAAKITDAEMVRRQDAVRAAIGDWRALYLLGVVHAARQDYVAALPLLEEAEHLRPGHNDVAQQIERARTALSDDNRGSACILEGHTRGVQSVAFSPDARLAVSSSEDNSIRLWELSTGQSILPIASQEDIDAIALHPSELRAIVASKDGTLSLWDFSDAKCLRTLDGKRAPVGRFGKGGLAFNGRQVLSWNSEQRLVLWDSESGRCVRQFAEGGGELKCVALSPDGHLALSGGGMGHHVRLWDVSTGAPVRWFEQDPHIVRGTRYGHGAELAPLDPTGGGGVLLSTSAVAFCPDGRHALSGGDDYTMRLWDVSSGRCIQKFRGHSDEITSLAVSPNGRLALSGGADATVRLWEIATGRCLRTFAEHERRLNTVAFSRDGRLALSGSDDETIRLWRLRRPDLPTLQLAKPEPLPDMLAEAGARRHCLANLRTALDESNAAEALAALAALEDLPGGARHPQTVQARRQVESLCDKVSVKSAWLAQSLDGHTFEVRAVTVSSDGSLAITAGGDNMVKLWDVAKGSCTHTFMGHLSAVKAVAFNADASLALSGGFLDRFKLWDVSTGVCLRTFQADDLSFEFERVVGAPVVSCLAFSPDGQLALSGENEVVRVWEISSGRRLRTFERHRIMVTTVAFSPDGTLALSGGGDYSLKLWDVSTGHRLRTFVGHTGTVEVALFDSTGRRAVSCSADGTLKLWEISSGKCLRTFEGHDGPVKTIRLSRDRRLIFSGGDDRTVRVWSIANGASIFVLPISEKINDMSLADDDWSLLVAAGRSVIRYQLDWELLPRTGS